jgi:baseplate J-like protein
MRPGPAVHRSHSHGGLLDEMARDARRRFHASPRPWDPARPESADLPDLGRGLLDCFALGLHVLWTYHEAWADEGFLATARLAASVRRLVELVGYHPDPGFSAAGLQHFRCKEGAAAALPPGFRVTAKAAGDRDAAVYETLRALDVSSSRNELRPFLPSGGAAPETAGAVATAVSLTAPQVPPPSDVAGPTALVDQVQDRLAAARAGSLAQRNAAAARQKSLRVAEVLSELQDQGAADLCGDAFDSLCQELCEAQSLANQAVDGGPVGPLSESQELLLARLRAMAARQPAALDSFQAALGRQDGESNEEWSRRLDQVTGFLDALVAGILQEARDQVVRLRGTRALTALDRAYRAAEADLGVAPPGTDTLFLLPTPGQDGRPPVTHAGLLRPGDWLVVGEDVEQVGPDGATVTTRVHREAVQLLRVRDEVPAGSREPATRITFTPPLTRRYRLDRTVLLGNVAEITHGALIVDERRWSAGGSPFLELPSSPLTWRRVATPDAAEGRIPEVELTVAGQRWQRRTDLRDSSPAATVFAVEIVPDGGARLRFGDGREAAAVPEGAVVSVRYRTGIGADGNRGAGAVDGVASANPAVASTFNPLPVTGGVEPEEPDVSKARAGAGVHALDRAISIADVRSLALSFGGVRRAAVLRDPLRRRDRMTVVVVGDRGEPLTDGDRARLRSFLVARMPPGAGVTVSNASRVPVLLRVVLGVEPGHDPLAVVREARVRLGVDPVDGAPPGLLQPGRPDLGEDLHLSDVYAALDGIPHLAAAFVEHLHRADEPPDRRDQIEVGATAVAVWGGGEPGIDPVAIAWEEARDL